MTSNQQTYGGHHQNRDAGMTDVIGSMMSLATACTRFTFHQMTNMMNMFTAPRSAMNNVKHSMDNISQAMNQPADHPMDESSQHRKDHETTYHASEASAEKKSSSSEPQQAEDALSGRKS